MNRLLSGLLVAAAAVGAFALIGPVTGSYRTTTVLSGSMRPTLDPGDVVIAVPTPSEKVRPGDIVTFQLPDGSGNVTHRVVDVDRSDGKITVTTKGDANEAADRYDVNFVGDTAWRTKAVIPKVGYLFVAVRAVLEQQLYLPAIGALLALSLLWSIWRSGPKDLDVTAA